MFRYLTYTGVFLLGFIIDAASKRAANKKPGSQKVLTVFEFRTLHNKGGAFGLLANRRKLLYVLGMLSFISGIVLFFLEKDHVFRLLLAVMLSGASGNMYERIRSGYVTDFFRIRYKRMPYTNIADMLLFIPALMLVIYYIFAGANG